jgi:hypothetical protein
MPTSQNTHPTTADSASGTAPSAKPGPRRRHPVTLLYSVPGWRPFLDDTTASLARIGGNVIFGVDWTTARLWWRTYDHLARHGQRVVVAAAAQALQTCMACGAPRSWREPTTRLPLSVIGTARGALRLRLCATCRLRATDAARFLVALEVSDAGAAR